MYPDWQRQLTRCLILHHLPKPRPFLPPIWMLEVVHTLLNRISHQLKSSPYLPILLTLR